MQKNRKKYMVLTVIAAGLMLILAGCCDNFLYTGLRGCGNISSEHRELGDFSEVTLGVPADVIINKAEETSLVIEADINLTPYITTDVRKGKLAITTDKNLRPSKRIIIYLETPYISSLETTGSGSYSVYDTFTAGEMSLKINGSGNISMKVDAGSLSSEIFGSGNIKLKGRSENHRIKINGSGNVEAYKLETAECKVKVMGSGNCFINVSESLDVNIEGSGDVHYMGSPAIRTTRNGSGRVIKTR
jgi:hypothetical protein